MDLHRPVHSHTARPMRAICVPCVVQIVAVLGSVHVLHLERVKRAAHARWRIRSAKLVVLREVPMARHIGEASHQHVDPLLGVVQVDEEGLVERVVDGAYRVARSGAPCRLELERVERHLKLCGQVVRVRLHVAVHARTEALLIPHPHGRRPLVVRQRSSDRARVRIGEEARPATQGGREGRQLGVCVHRVECDADARRTV